MKKPILLSLLMAGSLFQLTPTLSWAEESSESVSKADTQIQQKEITRGAFGENVLAPSTYPVSSLPSSINTKKLLEGIEAFYKENYSNEEITASQTPLTQEELDKLTMQLSKEIKDFDIDVDQIEFTLNDDKLYVPRVIVLKPLDEAFAQSSEHDSDLLLVALSELGNRITMISYYDETAQEITPLHLTNRTKSLFYNTIVGTKNME